MDHGGHSEEEDEEKSVDIVVTAPSSPDVPTQTNGVVPEYDGHDPELTFLALDTLSVPPPPSMPSPPVPPRTPFEDALAKAELPEPGPEHFAARREIWQTFRTRPPPPQTTQSSIRMRKFRAMLDGGSLESDACWNSGLDKFWKGLMTGQRVRERLALRDLVKVLQAGWIRDGTWPKGQVAPEPDDELKADETTLSPTTTDASRLATPSTPGTPVQEGNQGMFSRLLAIGRAGPSR